jgi:hypothetical protein
VKSAYDQPVAAAAAAGSMLKKIQQQGPGTTVCLLLGALRVSFSLEHQQQQQQ